MFELKPMDPQRYRQQTRRSTLYIALTFAVLSLLVSGLAVMLWGLELDRRLRTAGSQVVTHLTHPGWVASNLSHVSDSPLLSLAHRTVKFVADRVANDIQQGAAPTLYCISEPIPPGSYVGVTGRFGLRGGPVLIGRSPDACDYSAAAELVAFAERETGTVLAV